MLDTVRFVLNSWEAGGLDFLDEIPPCLDRVEIEEDGRFKGRLENLYVNGTGSILRVGNSLSKYQLGDNYQSMGRRDIQDAVERLSDTLHVSMSEATVTRLDLGISLPVKEPVRNYLNHLGAMPYSQRLEEPDGLYYQMKSGMERLCFYDKNKEQIGKGEVVPEAYKGLNVMRYEQRYMRKLSKLLKVDRVAASMLYEENFYIRLLEEWRTQYKRIRKIHDTTLNLGYMKGRKDLNRMGVLALVKMAGGEVAMLNQIAEFQKRGDLTSKQAHDIREGVKEACKCKEGLTVKSDLIDELDRKLLQAIAYYR